MRATSTKLATSELKPPTPMLKDKIIKNDNKGNNANKSTDHKTREKRKNKTQAKCTRAGGGPFLIGSKRPHNARACNVILMQT